jgi:hypothetical protein
MKIITANGKKKVVMTRAEWEAIGKTAQWNSGTNGLRAKAADTGYKGTYTATDNIYYTSAAPFMKAGESIEIVQSMKNKVRYRLSTSPTVFNLPIDSFVHWLEKGLLRKEETM